MHYGISGGLSATGNHPRFRTPRWLWSSAGFRRLGDSATNVTKSHRCGVSLIHKLVLVKDLFLKGSWVFMVNSSLSVSPRQGRRFSRVTRCLGGLWESRRSHYEVLWQTRLNALTRVVDTTTTQETSEFPTCTLSPYDDLRNPLAQYHQLAQYRLGHTVRAITSLFRGLEDEDLCVSNPTRMLKGRNGANGAQARRTRLDPGRWLNGACF